MLSCNIKQPDMLPRAGEESVTIRIILNSASLDDMNIPATRLYIGNANSYMEKNPGVKIEWIFCSDDLYFKTLHNMAASDDLPDIFLLWSHNAHFLPYVNGGLVHPLPAEEFADYGFFKNALEQNTAGGKLYALPRTISYRFIIYNQALFDQYQVKVPATFSELEKAVRVFRKNGIIPMAASTKFSGSYVFCMLPEAIMRINKGDASIGRDAAFQKISFSATPAFREASDYIRRLIDLGLFQDTYTQDDWPTVEKYLAEGKAAMIYTGGVSLNMGVRESIPREIRENLRCMPFPSMDGTDSSGTLVRFPSLGWAISSKTKHFEIALDILREWTKPENFAGPYWKLSLGIPAQDYSPYITGDETPLTKSFLDMRNKATAFSGYLFPWVLTPGFEEQSTDSIRDFYKGKIGSRGLWIRMDRMAAEKQLK